MAHATPRDAVICRLPRSRALPGNALAARLCLASPAKDVAPFPRPAHPAILQSLHDEHYQVAVGNGDWAVTVTVYGLMILDDMRDLKGGKVAPELFKRASSREQVVQMLTMMAKGEIDDIKKAGWVPRDQLPPYKRPLFRPQEK